MNLTFLLGIDSTRSIKAPKWTIQDSVKELEQLAQTAGLTVFGSFIQRYSAPHPTTYFGSGKLQELKLILVTNSIELVITDDELLPVQQKSLEKILEVKVLDRTGLILDIFAKRAFTHEAQLQVEMAQLYYLKPRLTGMWQHLSRLGGGIGTRGPGEKQLELDKRRIGTRISSLKKQLDSVKKQRALHREKRNSVPILSATLMGYTNAGKSTLMNLLTQSHVLVEDKLFATLDPTTRKLVLPNHETLLMTDTVGFIQKLPHMLVQAFHATLEMAMYSDLLLHVVDVSHARFLSFIDTGIQILKELGCEQKLQILVLNKVDLVKDQNEILQKIESYYGADMPSVVFVSALQNLHIDGLMAHIENILNRFRKIMTFFLSYEQMHILNLLYQYGQVLSVTYPEHEPIVIKVEINSIVGEKIMGLLGKNA